MKQISFFDLGMWDGAETDIFISFCERNNLSYTVYGFEPDLSLMNELKKKYGKNKNVILFNVAISDKEGSVNLYISDSSARQGNSIFSDKYNVSSMSYIVSTNKLSNYLHEEHLSYVNVLKFNIEGAELPMMKELIDSGKHKLIDLFFGSTPDIEKVASIKDKRKYYDNLLHDNGIVVHPFFHTANEEDMDNMRRYFEHKILNCLSL